MTVAPQGAPAVVQIPPASARTLDLLFPLPTGLAKASRLPAFDFVWRVQTPGKTVAERTPFERLSIVYYYSYGPWEPSWMGPYWAGAPAWVF
jgi:hypothetical protein